MKTGVCGNKKYGIDEAIEIAKNTLQEAAKDIKRRGFIVKSKAWDGETIEKLNPSVKTAREATAQLISLRNLRLQEQKAARPSRLRHDTRLNTPKNYGGRAHHLVGWGRYRQTRLFAGDFERNR
jgi:hypothetical protein